MPVFLNNDWAVYAREPMENQTKELLLGQLKPMIVGLSEVESANKLLNLVQTGFDYKTDRSFLFSYLVEKLLGLKTVLVSAPGHVFVAVLFNEPVKGDFIDVDGDKYLICDPTYIGSRIGMCMPSCKNARLEVLKI